MKIQADKWKKLALTLSLVIVINIFFNVGVATFYSMPDWNEYCPQSIYNEAHESKESCELAGGAWSESQSKVEGEADGGWCDITYTCQKEYNDQWSLYNRNVFIVLTVLGASTLVAGILLNLPSAVANGLLYGGALSMLIGTMRFWTEMDDYVRFIVSGVVLGVLIFLGIKKMQD